MVDKEDKIKVCNVNDCRTFLSSGGETPTNTEDISYDREEDTNDRETCIDRSLEEFGQSGLETGTFSPQHKFSTMVADSRTVNFLTVYSYGKIQEDRENEIMDDEIKRNGKKEEDYEEEVEKKEEQQTEEQQTEEYEEEKVEQHTEEYEEEKVEQQTEEYEEKKVEQQTEEYEEEKVEQQTEEYEEEVRDLGRTNM